MDINEIELEVLKIKARNKKVEAEKSWEISLSRKIAIAVLTYVVILLFFFVANLPNPFVNALVPSVAFLLSTATISMMKRVWMKIYL